jgi:hypothetical protein
MAFSTEEKERIASTFKYACSYCRISSEFVYGTMEIEHIIPLAKGGTNDAINLCLACSRCNAYKHTHTQGLDTETGEMVALFNPRTQRWSEHFAWDNDNPAIIVGITPCGKVTINILKMNLPVSVKFRQWLAASGKYPPAD